MLSIHELQTRHYWKLVSAVFSEISLSEYVDELEVLALHAHSPALRAACLRSIHRFDNRGKIARPAAVAQ